MTEGCLEQIIEINKKIVEYTEKIYGQNSEEYISSFIFEGKCLKKAACYKESLAPEEKAIALAEKVLGENHFETTTSYDNIGSTYYSLGDHTRALEYKLKALF